MKRLIILLSCLTILIASPALGKNWTRGAVSGITGGVSGYLDSFDGLSLQNGDSAVYMSSNGLYVWYLDSTCNLTEAAPFVVSPDSNAGTKRWILIQDPAKYYVNYGATDQGDDADDYSLKDVLSTIGTSKEATVVFKHWPENGNTTTYTVSTTYDASAYTNVTFVPEPGVRLAPATTKTLTLPSPAHVDALPTQQWVSGDGDVRFDEAGDVHVGWFGAMGDDPGDGTGTNDYAAIAKAIEVARANYSAARRTGSALVFQPRTYLVETSLFAGQNTATSNLGVYKIKGNGAVLYGKHTGYILDYTGMHGKTIEDLNFYGDSSTTPAGGLFLCRRSATTSAGQTTLKNCWFLGYYTVAALINYQSEEFDMHSTHIDVEAGLFAALFTDTGYYRNAAAAWVQLSMPNVDSDPGAVTSVDYYIRRCRFSHTAAAPSGAAALVQLVGPSAFVMTECYLNDTANDMPFIQFVTDATNGGSGIYNVTIENNTFHGTKDKSIEFLNNVNYVTILKNRWGTAATTADVYVAGVNLYDVEIETNTLDGSTANSAVYGQKLIIHTALNIATSLDGEVILDQDATLTLGAPGSVTAKIMRQDGGWVSSYEDNLWNGTLVTTSGTGEDDLITLTLPANYLLPYRALRIIGAGNIANANGNKTIKLHLTDSAVAPTTVTLTLAPASNYTSGSNWYFDITTQAGAATQALIGFASVAGAIVSTQDETGVALDLTTNITVKCTGECANGSDIVRQHLLKIMPY